MGLLRKNVDLNNCTLIEACVVLTGSYRKGGQLFRFCQEWMVVHHQLGHVPLQKDYAEFWDVSRSTTERRMAEFRAVFTKCESPSDLPRAQKRAELAQNFTVITGATVLA